MKTELGKLRELVGSKIFSVVFVKQDGTERKMVCRLGVTKHLKGGELKHSPEKLNHLIVFDLQAMGYRTINVNTLKSITFEGIKYDL